MPLLDADPQPLRSALKNAIAEMGARATRRNLVKRFCEGAFGDAFFVGLVLETLDELQAAHEIGCLPSGAYHLGHVTMSAVDLHLCSNDPRFGETPSLF